MNLTPPAGSRIRIVGDDTAEPYLAIPAARNGDQLFTTVLLFTVCVMMVSASLQMAPCFDQRVYVNPQLVTFLGVVGLYGGVILIGYLVYRIVHPGAPVHLHLQRDGLGLDSGFQRARVLPGAEIIGWWSRCRGMRIGCKIDLAQTQSLRLRASFDGRRLTVDVDGQRIEIGRGVSEAEREWLAVILADRYGLPHELVGCR